MRQIRIALGVVISVVLAACSQPESGGLVLLGETEMRLGEVSSGQTAKGTVRVRNDGKAPLRLHATWERGGDVFSLQQSGDLALQPQETAELEVVYAAPSGVSAIQHDGLLAIRADGASSGRDQLVIRVTAGTISSACNVSEILDFGIVPVQRSATAGIVLRNPDVASMTAQIGPFLANGAGPTPFSFDSTAYPGEAELAPGAELTVDFVFAPASEGTFSSAVRVRPSPACPETIVVLTGEAVSAPLRVAPEIVHCGPVPVGLEGTAQIRFFNDAAVPVALAQLEATNATEFRIVEGQALTLPGATRLADGTWSPGAGQVTVACAPKVLGLRTSNLSFTTDLPKQPTGTVPLHAWGGGPDVELGTTSLDFGKVAYFAGAAVGRTIELELRNVGNVSPTGSELNLRFAPNAFKIVPVVDGTLPGEFTAELPAKYDPAVGLSAGQGENIVRVPIRFVPQSAGVKQAKLHLFTNDLDEPELIVDLHAQAVVVPSCSYSVAPASLDFGRVAMPHERELAVTFRNEGTNPEDVCLLYGGFLTAGGGSGFALAEPAGASIEVGAGQSRQLRMRFAPNTAPSVPTNVSGALELQVSSQTAPDTVVPATASVGSGCLVAGPDLVSFGTVKPGCRSETRTVRVYNTCAASVSLDTIELSGGADTPFSLASAPSLPASLLPEASPLTFQVAYAPTRDGEDYAALSITTVENGAPVLYRVGLAGRGDASGVQTDVFGASAPPNVDVLMVIDEGCSHDQRAQWVARRAQFFSHATANAVDFRIASTVMADPTYPDLGKLLHGSGNPRVLTPDSNLATEFEAKVFGTPSVSGTEACLDPAVRALSAPLIANENTGFLRREASLSILCLADEIEQSPLTWTYYVDALRNLKGNGRAPVLINAFSFGDACIPGGAAANNYGPIVAATGGIVGDICTSDWDQMVKRVGDRVFGATNQFPLSAYPNPDVEPVLRSDGVIVPQTTGQGGVVWTMDPISNVLTLNPGYLNPTGKRLEVSYERVCHPN